MGMIYKTNDPSCYKDGSGNTQKNHNNNNRSNGNRNNGSYGNSNNNHNDRNRNNRNYNNGSYNNGNYSSGNYNTGNRNSGNNGNRNNNNYNSRSNNNANRNNENNVNRSNNTYNNQNNYTYQQQKQRPLQPLVDRENMEIFLTTTADIGDVPKLAEDVMGFRNNGPVPSLLPEEEERRRLYEKNFAKNDERIAPDVLGIRKRFTKKLPSLCDVNILNNYHPPEPEKEEGSFDDFVNGLGKRADEYNRKAGQKQVSKERENHDGR